MCYSGNCIYEDHMGECHSGTGIGEAYPEDAMCTVHGKEIEEWERNRPLLERMFSAISLWWVCFKLKVRLEKEDICMILQWIIVYHTLGVAALITQNVLNVDKVCFGYNHFIMTGLYYRIQVVL